MEKRDAGAGTNRRCFCVSYGGEKSRKNTQISACARRGDANVRYRKEWEGNICSKRKGKMMFSVRGIWY